MRLLPTVSPPRRPPPATVTADGRKRIVAGLRPAIFFALAALPFAALAQPAADDEIVQLPPWSVTQRVEPRTAPARGDTFAATLGATAVVDQRAWSGRSVATLAEALRGVPGVVLQESFGGFEPPRLLIRGSGLDSAPTSRGVALLVDGLSFARADGSFHSGLLDPQLFSRIEVYRGTVHAALTPAVLGGVLNAVSPSEREPPTTLRFEAGSFEAVRAGLATGFSAAATTAHLSASLARQVGFRPHSSQQRVATAAIVRRELSPERVLEISAYAAHPEYDVPGPLTLTEALNNPRSVSAAVARDRPHRDSSLVRLAAQFKSGPARRATALGLAWQRWSDDFRQLQTNGETEATGEDLNGHATLVREIEIGTTQHHLLARAIFSAGTTDYQRYLNDRGTRGTRFADLDFAAGTAAISVEDVVWLRPELALGGGVTALQARRTINGPAGVARTIDVTDVSPRAGLHWQLNNDLSLFAAASRGVEPPTFDDLVSVQGSFPSLNIRSRDLRAQAATTIEFGVRSRTKNLFWSATVYRGAWHQEILRLADAAGSPLGAVNTRDTVHEGIEASARWRIVDGVHRLSLGATATWNRFRFADDPVYGTNRLAGAPPHLGNAELLYEHPRGWSAGIESTWITGRTPVDHANRMHYDGHTLLNARLRWKLGPRLTIHVTARNVFDRRHIASTAGVLDIARNPAATAIFLPGAGRNFTLGLEWQ